MFFKAILCLVLSVGCYGLSAQSAFDCGALSSAYPVKPDGILAKPAFADQIGKLGSIYNSTSNFELRYYEHHGIVNGAYVTVISCKGRGIKATRFYYWFGKNHRIDVAELKKVKKRTVKPSKDWQVIFEDLEQLHFFSLPDMKEIRPKMKKYGMRNGKMTEHQMSVADGTGFTIQLKNGENYRTYSYDNPGSYHSFYTDVEELRFAEEVYGYLAANLKTRKARIIKYPLRKLFN